MLFSQLQARDSAGEGGAHEPELPIHASSQDETARARCAGLCFACKEKGNMVASKSKVLVLVVKTRHQPPGSPSPPRSANTTNLHGTPSTTSLTFIHGPSLATTKLSNPVLLHVKFTSPGHRQGCAASGAMCCPAPLASLSPMKVRLPSSLQHLPRPLTTPSSSSPPATCKTRVGSQVPCSYSRCRVSHGLRTFQEVGGCQESASFGLGKTPREQGREQGCWGRQADSGAMMGGGEVAKENRSMHGGLGRTSSTFSAASATALGKKKNNKDKMGAGRVSIEHVCHSPCKP